MNRRRFLVGVGAGAALLTVAWVPRLARAFGAGPSASELLAAFAKMPGLEAKFREEKHMALLAKPIVNEGSLHYHRGMLARHTDKPAKSSVVVRDGKLSFGDASGSDSLDLSSSPVVRLFVDSFVKIFAGDRTALESMYALTFAAEGAGWKMVLKPKVDPMRGTIDVVELSGSGKKIASMRVVEKGGDETLTTFSAVDTGRRYSAKEVARVFAVR